MTFIIKQLILTQITLNYQCEPQDKGPGNQECLMRHIAFDCSHNELAICSCPAYASLEYSVDYKIRIDVFR